jgi:TetR/AcrR family transcriptional regulator, cholesterol catabolism regulator
MVPTVDRQERRRRLLEVAHQALRQQDYEHIQMREVASAAEMALGTIYEQFSSKEHLYAAVLLQWGALSPDVGRRGRVSAPERVRADVEDMITAYERWPYLYRLYPALQGTGDRNAQVLLTEFTAAPFHRLSSDLRMVDPDGAEAGATMLWSLLAAWLSFDLTQGGDVNEVRRLSARLLDLLLDRW